MATESVEKRAYDLHKKVEQRLCSLFESGSTSIFKIHANVVDLIQEQDLIARNEERERCILMAQKYACRNCLNEGICDGTRMCTIKSNIRKAIEEGGNNGTES